MTDIIIGVILAGLSGWVYLQAQTFPRLAAYPGPGFFPKILALGLLCASFCLIGLGIRNCLRGARFRGHDWRVGDITGIGNFLTTVVLILVYIVCASRIGFFLSSALVLCLLASKLGTRPWVSFIVAAVAAAFLRLLFYNVFKIPLPYGPLPGGW